MLRITKHLTILNRCSTRILGKPQPPPPPQRWGCLFSNHNRGVIYVAVTRHDLDSAGAQRRRAIDPHGPRKPTAIKAVTVELYGIDRAATPPQDYL